MKKIIAIFVVLFVAFFSSAEAFQEITPEMILNEGSKIRVYHHSPNEEKFDDVKKRLIGIETDVKSTANDLGLALVSVGHDIKRYNSEQIIASEERQNIVSSMTIFTCTGILMFFGFMCYFFLRKGIAQVINNLFISDKKFDLLEDKVDVVFNAVQDTQSLNKPKYNFIDIEKLELVNELPKKRDDQVMISYSPDNVDDTICLILEVKDGRAVSFFINKYGNPFTHDLKQSKDSKCLIENKKSLNGNIKTFLSGFDGNYELANKAIKEGKFFRLKK